MTHDRLSWCDITLQGMGRECKIALQDNFVSKYDKRVIKLIKEEVTYLIQQIEEHRRVRNLVLEEED